MAVRVALAEDSFIVREGVARVLAAPEGDIEVVALLQRTSTMLLAAVESERPDVVVTDIRMPPTHTDEGIRLARDAPRHPPRRSASSS